MEKVTLKFLRQIVKVGIAENVSTVPSAILPEKQEVLAYAVGAYGLNGYLYKGKDNRLYAIVGHYSNLYLI